MSRGVLPGARHEKSYRSFGITTGPALGEQKNLEQRRMPILTGLGPALQQEAGLGLCSEGGDEYEKTKNAHGRSLA